MLMIDKLQQRTQLVYSLQVGIETFEEHEVVLVCLQVAIETLEEPEFVHLEPPTIPAMPVAPKFGKPQVRGTKWY